MRSMFRSSSAGNSKAIMETMEARRLMSTVLSGGILTVTGTAGNDRLEVDQYNGEIYVFENGLLGGGFGGIFPATSVSRVVIHGLDGHDTMIAHAALARQTDFWGGNGDDSMYGNIQPNYMFGAAGRDYMWAEGGNDSLAGGDGNDLIYAGHGNDLVSGYAGEDLIFGGVGNDTIYGDVGHDTILGEDGNDWIRSDSGWDLVYAGNGNDTVYGGWDNDQIFGEAGTDWLFGEDGNDTINGGANSDYLYGGNHDDFFQAFDNTWDQIDGGAGYDRAQCDKRPWWDPWQVQDSLYSIESSFE